MDAYEPVLLDYYLEVEFAQLRKQLARLPGVYVVRRPSNLLGQSIRVCADCLYTARISSHSGVVACAEGGIGGDYSTCVCVCPAVRGRLLQLA